VSLTNFWYVYSVIQRPWAKTLQFRWDPHFEQFINNEIKSSHYGSVSEFIRTELRLLEREEGKLNELGNALIIGEESGWIEDFNPEENLNTLHKKYK
jgi:antitoxin ParD1/3/4